VNRTHTLRVRGTALAGCLALLAFSAACRKKPDAIESPGDLISGRVSLERPAPTVSESTDWKLRTFPARFSKPILPEFPLVAVESRVESASVRVEFVIGADGLAHQLTAVVTQDVPHSDAFIAAALEVMGRWRFSPAWRLVRDAEEAEHGIVLLETKSFVVFCFDLSRFESGDAIEVSFGEDG